VNGFWFCLGWCLAFLVPSLVLAVQLGTVYRYTQAANGVSHSDDVITPLDMVTEAEDFKQPQVAPPVENSVKPKESTSVPAPDYDT